MEARKLSESESSPFEVSLRIRHPAMDPAEISRTLQFEPEHCFKAGEARSASSSAGHARHAQTYWLAPITLLEERASWAEEGQVGPSLEGQLFALLVRLNTHQEFLQRLRSEGGDVSILVAVSRTALRGFTLSEAIARFLAKLGIDVAFEFVTAE